MSKKHDEQTRDSLDSLLGTIGEDLMALDFADEDEE